MQLPEELIVIVARHYYHTRERLLTFLQMSLICKAFRMELDAVSQDQEKRWAFLSQLSQKNTVYFGETMDFDYLIEKQLILAFEMTYRLRATFERHIQQYIDTIGIESFYVMGYLPLRCRSNHFIQADVRGVGQYDFGDFLLDANIIDENANYFDDSIIGNESNYPSTLLLKALSNLNHYMKSILHAELVFMPLTNNNLIKSPYDSLYYDAHVYIIPSKTTACKNMTFIGGKLFQ